MDLFSDIFKGMISVLAVNNPPLYRYPYRNTMEAFRNDWKRIGSDVESAAQYFTLYDDKAEREGENER